MLWDWPNQQVVREDHSGPGLGRSYNELGYPSYAALQADVADYDELKG